MPIVKKPLEHKFGIVSLSRAESLLAQSRQKTVNKKPCRSSSPTEITQEFVTQYNEVSGVRREGLDLVIQTALHHAKYRAGLQHQAPSSPPQYPPSDDADIVDVSSAWLELTLLAQCFGQYQQDALLVLALSLNHAPLSTAHIPSLLYIAGLCYQWLKSDQLSDENILRTGELLLLKVLYLACLRVHYHHLVGALEDSVTREDIEQLRTDVQGFEAKEKTYRNFPEALLQWRLALEVGLLVCEVYGNTVTDPTPLPPTSSGASGHITISPDNTDKNRHSTVSTTAQSVMTGSHGSRLTPILWHSLDLWQNMSTKSESLDEAVIDMLGCSTDFDCGGWLEGSLAMCLLCVASQRNARILGMLQSLASASMTSMQHSTTSVSIKTTPPPLPESGILKDSYKSPSVQSIKRETRFNLPPSVESSQPLQEPKPSTLNMLGMQPEFDAALLGSMVTLVTVVSEDEEQSNYHSPFPSTVGTQSLIESEIIPETLPSSDTSHTTLTPLPTDVDLCADLSNTDKHLMLSKLSFVSAESTEMEGHALKAASQQASTTEQVNRLGLLDLCYPTQQESLKQEKSGSQYTQSHAPLSDGVGVPGSQVAPSTVYRRSVFSTPDPHLESQEPSREACLKSWSTDTTLLYTLGMADTVIYGLTSNIQKTALLGEAVNNGTEVKLRGCGGLVQLSEFSNEEHKVEKSSFGVSASSWAVRHVAVLGLSRVCKVCGQLPLRDGFSHMAWSRLMDRHATEQDSRVLEAFKISQACPDVDGALLAVDEHTLSSPLLGHIADGLCRLFLPPVSTLATYLHPPKPRKKTGYVQKKAEQGVVMPLNKKVEARVSTKRVGKVLTAPSFNTRTMGALNKIAEEHWRRQIEEEERVEQEEQRDREERVRREEEEKFKRKQEKLAKNKPLSPMH